MRAIEIEGVLFEHVQEEHGATTLVSMPATPSGAPPYVYAASVSVTRDTTALALQRDVRSTSLPCRRRAGAFARPSLASR